MLMFSHSWKYIFISPVLLLAAFTHSLLLPLPSVLVGDRECTVYKKCIWYFARKVFYAALKHPRPLALLIPW
jgi:hypothetical protein